jgi:uncharacterized protein YkwD
MLLLTVSKAMRRLAFALAALISITALGQAQPYRAVDVEGDIQTAETAIGTRIAAERAEFAPHAAILTSDPVLTAIARERSEAMAHGAPFAHEDEKGQFAAGSMVQRRLSRFGAVGENIMMEHDPSRSFDAAAFARRAVAGWMSSEGHRGNILSPAFARSGIGVAVNGSYAYATQVFWGPPPKPAGQGLAHTAIPRHR